MQGLNILQCNLGREKLAHEVAFVTMAEGDYDLMVVSEPNRNITDKHGWVTDLNRVVAVYFRNKKTKVHRVDRKAGFLEVHLPGVTIVAGYISPNVDIGTYEEALDGMLGGRRQEDEIVILGDLNAKSHLWGSPTTDRRGEILGEWTEALGLTILNEGNEPTFVRGDSHSFIDVTFASERVAGAIEGWRVLDIDSATLHKYIAFRIKGIKPRRDSQTFRQKNWEVFREVVRGKIEVWRVEGLSETKLMKDVGEAYRECLGPRGREGGGRPYWWDEDIGRARENMTRARREVTRARRRRDRMEEETINLLQEVYRIKKRRLNQMILKAKSNHWQSLCQQLEQNPWGDAYRIVTKKLGVKPYEMSLQRKREVARELFPEVQEPEGDREDLVEAPPFTVEELREAIQGFKTGKAPGMDGIPPEAIKEVAKIAEEWILGVLNELLARQYIPEKWKIARLVLIPKGGGGDKARPICLLNTINKLYETLIKNRLEDEIKERGGLSNKQFGFRKGLSTIHAVKEAVGGMRRNVEWAAMVTLDVKNAFNTVRWGHIKEELARRGIPQYLRNVIAEYLKDRKLEIERGEVMQVSAGVPQGSVLGPTLWNVAYDGVLRLRWPEGVKVVGFADDLAVVAMAKNEKSLVQNVNDTLKMVDGWMVEKGLELAPQKTEVVMLRGPRKKKHTTFLARDVVIQPQKQVKYLGVWVDDQGTFGHHVKEATRKAADRTAALSRIMPNIGGPSYNKRRVIYEVVASTLLYAAPVWLPALRIGRYEQMMLAAQRKALLRVAMAYRTVSTPAIQVITGVPPITLLAEERGRLFQREDRGSAQAKREEREKTLESWQRRWEEEAGGRGQWTRTLIPRLKEWLECPHRSLNYFMTQALTGHGSFRTFTYKIKKTEDDACVYCGEVDTPAHTLFDCRRWVQERDEISREVGETLRQDNLIRLMMEDQEKWRSVDRFIGEIMKKKETEEREGQR